MHDRNDLCEALWVVSMAGIGLLFLVILYLTGQVMAAYEATAGGDIPVAYWALVGVFVLLCALIPVLLRNSQPPGFRILAILFTAVAPVATVALIVANLWYLLH